MTTFKGVALKDVADRFHLLKCGLAFVLMFVGTKMLIVDIINIPVLVSLGGVDSIIVLSVVARLLYPRAGSISPNNLSARKE